MEHSASLSAPAPRTRGMDAIVNGRHVVGHSGRSAGAANHLDTYPDADWTVVVLGNYDTSVAPIGETARQIIT